VKGCLWGKHMLSIGLSIPVLAQQASLPCGGPPPPPPGLEQDGGPNPKGLSDWREALANWRPCPKPIIAGTISAGALAFRPPKAARKAFDQGEKAARNHSPREALAHFEDAVRINPDYLQAHVQLGILHAEADQPSLALESFLTALALEPDSDFLQFNVALTLVVLHRPAEAEAYARRALRRAPSSVDARFVLGVALVMQDNLAEETVASLRLASERHVLARDLLAWIEGAPAAANVPGK
jgi:tetratricopeptide (TPR) repeat protein